MSNDAYDFSPNLPVTEREKLTKFLRAAAEAGFALNVRAPEAEPGATTTDLWAIAPQIGETEVSVVNVYRDRGSNRPRGMDLVSRIGEVTFDHVRGTAVAPEDSDEEVRQLLAAAGIV